MGGPWLLLLASVLAAAQAGSALDSSTSSSRTLAGIPGYSRGEGYEYMLSMDQRERGLGYLGSKRRLKAVLQRLRDGKNIHVTAVGGSVTAGLHGARDGHSWPDYLFNHLEDAYPGQVTGHNGAVPGTISSYMSACVNIHVPQETDLVLVEYTVNDVYATKTLLDNEYRRAYERLLRKLLMYPKAPAVVLMHSYNWMAPPIGAFWNSIEREFMELAYYYDLPSLSLKAATYHLLRGGSEGFQVDAPRHDDVEGLAGKAFYWDKIHPDSLTGLRAMGELAMHLVSSVGRDMECDAGDGGGGAPDAVLGEDIPSLPMVAGNHAAQHDRCFIGDNFKSIATKNKSFEWADDSNGRAEKWGYISTVRGAELQLTINTMANSAMGEGSKGKKGSKIADLVMVQIAHVKSYETMAAAKLSCVSGCTCEESTIEGHQPAVHNTQLYLHVVYVSQAEECVLSISVPFVRADRFKVKISGIIVSEETGEMAGADKTQDSVELVSTVTAGGGGFDVRNKQRNPVPKTKAGRRAARR